MRQCAFIAGAPAGLRTRAASLAPAPRACLCASGARITHRAWARGDDTPMPSRSRSRSRGERRRRSRSRSLDRRSSRSPSTRHHLRRGSPDQHQSSHQRRHRGSRSRSRSRSRDRHRSRHHHPSSRDPSPHDRHSRRHRPSSRGRSPHDRQQPHARALPPPPDHAPPDDRGGAARRSRWEAEDPGRARQQQPAALPPPPPAVQLPPPPAVQLPPPPAVQPRWALPPVSDGPPPTGSVHKGRVNTIKPFGIFIGLLGYRRDVLVHHTQVSDTVQLSRDDDDDMKVKALEYAAERGQEVWVKVTDVTPDASGSGFRVHGSMLLVSQEDGRDLDPTGQLAAAAKTAGRGAPMSDEPPEEGSIHHGTVKRIEPYGVFVALPGFRRFGLVHSSQVANYLEFSAEDTDEDKRRALGEVAALGDMVWVKVVEVAPSDEAGRGPKVGCSMKLVDQTSGADLDPQGLRYRPRGEGGGGGGRGGRGPIGADAGEMRGGAINWGYLAGEVKQYGDGKQYALLDEEDVAPRGGARPGAAPGAPGPAHGPSAALAPAGRGRGATLPAWMTSGPAPVAPGPSAPAAPGSAAAAPPKIASLEEALAIVQQAAKHKSKKSKAKKKKKKGGKKEKRGKSEKKHKKSSRRSSSSTSSSSGGSSGDSGGSRGG